MKELFYKKITSKSELFIQVTDYTHGYEIINITHKNEKWSENKNQFSQQEYRLINFENNYEPIAEGDFAEAQNNILSSINKTRQQLQKEYRELWFSFLTDKLRIEEWLIESRIDLSNYYKVTEFRQRKEFEMDLDKKREAIYNAFQENHPKLVSNEDIFNKTASEINNSYLERRAEIFSKKQ